MKVEKLVEIEVFTAKETKDLRAVLIIGLKALDQTEGKNDKALADRVEPLLDKFSVTE